MKIEIKENNKVEEFTYPFIGIGNISEVIVLFYAKSEGVILGTGSKGNYKKGEIAFGFEMELFKPYNGTITLQND